MVERVFDFYGRFRIGVRASDKLMDRIAANIQTETAGQFNCLINIHEPKNYEKIIKDKRYPYLTVGLNPFTGGTEYKRYNTFVREIRVVERGNYEVRVNTEGDEAAGLICFRHFCNNHPSMVNIPLIHASLINLNGDGILMSGDARAGKTTLMIYLMQQFKAGLVSEDNVFLEPNMVGIYFPKVPQVRFSTVRDSCLSSLLTDLPSTGSTQYWDIESIEKVVAEGKLDVDGSLTVSRKKMAEMCGVETHESIRINKVIFPSYSEKELSFEEMPTEEGFSMLERFGREKKKDLHPRDIEPESISLRNFERDRIRFYKLKFNGLASLLQGGFSL